MQPNNNDGVFLWILVNTDQEKRKFQLAMSLGYKLMFEPTKNISRNAQL